MRATRKLYMIVFVWLLAMLQARFAMAETLIIHENRHYAVTKKLYASPAEYQCAGWNIFYDDAANKNRYFFFVKFFYSHCLSPWQEPEFKPSPTSCSIDSIARRFAKRLALKTDMTVDATVAPFDTLVLVTEKGVWIYEGATVLEMFALQNTPVTTHFITQGILNTHLVPLSQQKDFSTDTLTSFFWNEFSRGVQHVRSSLYLVHRQASKYIFGRTYRGCMDCINLFNLFFVFDPEKGITKFYSPYRFLAVGPNMRSFTKYYDSDDLFWYQ